MAQASEAVRDVDVFVAGAGPTGLMAAALLVRCGVRVRIVSKAAGPAPESRAFGVQARSMELFQAMGVADAVLERGVIASGVQMIVDAEVAATLDFDDVGRQDTPFPFLMMVPQWEIEAVLAEDLRRLGLAVEYNTEVTGFTQDDAGVAVSLRRPDGKSETTTAAFLVGADGAHSTVRKALGLTFAGAAYPQSFFLADCRLDWPFDYDHVKVLLHGRNFALYMPLRGQALCRVLAITPAQGDVSAPVDQQGAAPATLDEVQAALRAAAGDDVVLSDARWVTRYRVHHRGVDRYGEGRVFVAGDAAHIHSPVGAQGMNTGLQDAANLAWKLAAVLQGRAPPGLLDTYHSERWPVGQKVLNYTDRLFAGVSSQSTWVSALRNRVLPLAAGTVSRSGTLRARAFHFISQLGIRYHDSGFVADGSSAGAPKAWREGLSAGHRAPDGAIAAHRHVFDLIGGYRFHLLALSRKPLDEPGIQALANALTALPDLGGNLQVHLIANSLVGRHPLIERAESGEVFRAYGLDEDVPQALFLVRPDGHIAWRCDSLDVEALRGFMARFAVR